MSQAGDGLVVKLAFGFVGAFDQHHPAGQAGSRAAVVEKGQPFAPVQGVALAVRVVVAAQALEQTVELLQPGTGRCAVVRLGHQCELGQGRDAHRVQRLFGAHDWAVVGKQAS
ncbi:hypothetical protein D3C87_1580650 [compost metagenome]